MGQRNRSPLHRPGLHAHDLVLTPVADDEQALLTVADWFRGFAWERALVGVAAFYHLSMAAVLGFADSNQAISSAAEAAFQLLPRPAWIALFLFAGISACLLIRGVTVARQLCTWLPINAIGFGWVAAFALALSQDQGSGMGLVAWLSFLAVWGIAAVRIGRGKR